MKRIRLIIFACLIISLTIWLSFPKKEDNLRTTTPSPNRIDSALSEQTGAGLHHGGTRTEMDTKKRITPTAEKGDPEIRALLNEARTLNRLAEFGAELASLGTREAISTLIRAIDMSNAKERGVLARGLQALHSSEPAEDIQRLMADYSEEADVAVQARDALARIATAEDVLRISQSLPVDPEEGLVRSYMLGALARVRNPKTVKVLTELCSTTKEPGIYTAAAIALGGIGNPEAVASLIKLIEDQQITNVNDPIVQALISVKNKESSHLLERIKAQSKNPVVNYAVDQALSSIRGQSVGGFRSPQPNR